MINTFREIYKDTTLEKKTCKKFIFVFIIVFFFYRKSLFMMLNFIIDYEVGAYSKDAIPDCEVKKHI